MYLDEAGPEMARREGLRAMEDAKLNISWCTQRQAYLAREAERGMFTLTSRCLSISLHRRKSGW